MLSNWRRKLTFAEKIRETLYEPNDFLASGNWGEIFCIIGRKTNGTSRDLPGNWANRVGITSTLNGQSDDGRERFLRNVLSAVQSKRHSVYDPSCGTELSRNVLRRT